MKVVIAEKPSYAKTIAKALIRDGERFERKDGYLESKNYYITWQFGYLFELYTIEDYSNLEAKGWREDILPFIPEDANFKFKLKNDNGVKKQYEIIRELVNKREVSEIVHAGDADSAGSCLVWVTMEDIKRKDNINKPNTRLWSNDQTEVTILESLHNLKNINEYSSYCNEELTRSCIDFLLGINLTRKFSLMNNRLTKSREIFSVGRCNTSIVSMIYERDMEIRTFRPKDYLQLESLEETNNEVIKLVDKNKFEYEDKNKAIIFAKELNSNKAIVESVEEKVIKKEAPKLFSLPSIQGLLSERYKMTMDESLKAIQSLYEAGYVTYPRTNSEYLSEEEIPKVQKIIDSLNKDGYNLRLKNTKAIFNNEMIESHSALIITDKKPIEGSLKEKEEIVYKTIKNRFLAKFLNEETKINQTKITINIGEIKFELKGEVLKEEKGFYKYEPYTKSKDKNILPNLKEGDEVNIKFVPVKKQTTPPAKITIKTLNNMLENPFKKEYKDEKEQFKDILEGISIGTAATRSGIIENTKRFGYIIENKGVLSITEKGIYLIETLKALNIDMSKNRTVEFSKILKKVFRGEIDNKTAILQVYKELNNMFENIKESNEIKGYSKEAEELVPVGKCPRCQRNILESSKAFYCEGFKDKENQCTFVMWKENKFFINKGRKLTKVVAKKLLSDGKAYIKGFKKKDGSGTYDAYVLLDDTREKYVNFKLEFIEEVEVIGKCPRCQRNILESSKAFYCEGWKDKDNPCKFTMWKENKFFSAKGKKLSKSIAKSLLSKGKAHVRGLKKKDDSGFYDADIVLNDTGEYVNFKLDIK